jgi:hypothetical protein
MGLFVYYSVLLSVARIAHWLLGWERTDGGVLIVDVLGSNFLWGLLILFGNSDIYSSKSCALWVFIYALEGFITYGYNVCHLLWPTVPSLISYANYNMFYFTAPLACGSIMLMLTSMANAYEPSTCSIKTYFMSCYFLCPIVFSYLYEGWKHKRAAHYATCNKKAASLF